DPRARVIRAACHEVLEKLGSPDDPLFELAMALEETALKDDYFIERKLYPNVDFYSGLIYKALGIPANMFTVMFAIARTVGWVAQWMEMIAEPEQRIGRPRQLYVGPARRDYPANNTLKKS
ncbi:MAG TPA: citrate (Si)-synthase, partial [Gammaproteobacteria bacterium]|nr:citrate (Si)-synthase [Gammaproteobacteria bacterium]